MESLPLDYSQTLQLCLTLEHSFFKEVGESKALSILEYSPRWKTSAKHMPGLDLQTLVIYWDPWLCNLVIQVLFTVMRWYINPSSSHCQGRAIRSYQKSSRKQVLQRLCSKG